MEEKEYRRFKNMLYEGLANKKKPSEQAQKNYISLSLMAYRREHKLTQKELADRLKVPVLQIVRWETRKNIPSYLALDRLKEFGIVRR